MPVALVNSIYTKKTLISTQKLLQTLNESKQFVWFPFTFLSENRFFLILAERQKHL